MQVSSASPAVRHHLQLSAVPGLLRSCPPVVKSYSRHFMQHSGQSPQQQCPRGLAQQQVRGRAGHIARITPFDQAWGTQIDGQSLASQLFAMSLFPYLAFLFYLHRSGKAPKLTLIGFYFLLAFVGATIPAGIYAKTHYGTSLANVDWLHGTAESLLTITNLLIVLGLRQGIKEAEAKNAAAAIQAPAEASQRATEADGSTNGHTPPTADEAASTGAAQTTSSSTRQQP